MGERREYRRVIWKIKGETRRDGRGDRRGGEWENFFNMYVDELIVLKITEPRISCTAKLARAYTEMSSFLVKCKSWGQAGHLEFLNSETRTFS